MKGAELVKDLRKKFPEDYHKGGDDLLADRLGLSRQTIRNWSHSAKELSAFQVSNALVKAQKTAIARAQFETIQPIVEFYPIECARSKQEASLQILPLPDDCSQMQRGVRSELEDTCGIYVFYDSRGSALYVGKARKQSIWKEMNLAYNRARGDVQSLKIVRHPSRNKVFEPAYRQPRQPKARPIALHAIADYFSAYWVADGMINDLEALLVRGFANDLLNVRMERFNHARMKKEVA